MPAAILLVDDEPAISRLLEIYLGKEFMIARATTASEAVDALSRTPFDVILLDVKLPDRPGWSLLQEIKQAYPSSRVLIMTGYSDEETRKQAAQRGADGIILKPSTPAAVKQQILALL